MTNLNSIHFAPMTLSLLLLLTPLLVINYNFSAHRTQLDSLLQEAKCPQSVRTLLCWKITVYIYIEISSSLITTPLLLHAYIQKMYRQELGATLPLVW